MRTLLNRVRGALRRSEDDRERGDVPGWVLITLMTAALVVLIWGVASDRLVEIFNRAMDAQCCAVGVSCGVVAVYCLFCGACCRAGTVFQGRGGVWVPLSAWRGVLARQRSMVGAFLGALADRMMVGWGSGPFGRLRGS